jgi:hypothetical protein
MVEIPAVTTGAKVDSRRTVAVDPVDVEVPSRSTLTASSSSPLTVNTASGVTSWNINSISLGALIKFS